MSTRSFDATVSTTSAKRREANDQLEKLQGKTFGCWASSILKKSGHPPIEDVTTDLKDGVNLIYLVEALFEVDLGKKFQAKPTTEIHKNENVTLALEFLKTQNISLTVSSKDIVDGNRKLTLGLVWLLVMRHQMLKPGDDDKPPSQKNKQAKTNLLAFCQKQLQGYPGVDVKDFQESFYDGLAFCALIHKLNPELLNYEQMLKATPKERFEKAFEAGAKVGIPQLLDVQDLCNPDVSMRPDEKCIMTYVSEFPIAFLEHSRIPQTKKQEIDVEELLKKHKEETERRERELREEHLRIQGQQELLHKQTQEKEAQRMSAQEMEEKKKLLAELERLKSENKKLQDDLSQTKSKLIGVLHVHVIQAKSLPPMDLLGKSDPYCRLKLADQEYKTHTIKRDLNPHWDQQFEFFVTDNRQVLELAVWDWDRFLSDDFIGKITIRVSELQDGVVVDKWFKLQPLKGSDSPNLGEVHLSILFKIGK
jgi:hypothetical protein